MKSGGVFGVWCESLAHAALLAAGAYAFGLWRWGPEAARQAAWFGALMVQGAFLGALAMRR